MRNFFNAILSAVHWLWKRPVVQEALTALQARAWADLKDIGIQAVAEAKAGNLTDAAKRQQAFDRIKAYIVAKGQAYPDSIINWVIEHAYQRFVS